MILVNYLIFTLNYPKITQNSLFLLKLWPLCDQEANMRNMKKYAWPDTHFRFYLTHILNLVSPQRLWTKAKYIYFFQNFKKKMLADRLKINYAKINAKIFNLFIFWPFKKIICDFRVEKIEFSPREFFIKSNVFIITKFKY